MKLHDLHGQEFELKILGYQFRGNLDNKWDANWLNIQIIVNSKQGKWKSIDPSLSTGDIEKISEWIAAIPQKKAEKIIDFIEPNLKFENVSNDKNFIIRIYFELESRPSPTEGVGSDDFFIELILDENELLQASRDLQEDLKHFPIKEV